MRKKIMSMLNDRISQMEARISTINDELSCKTFDIGVCNKFCNELYILSVETKALMNSKLKYIFDSLNNQCNDFELFNKIEDREEQKSYINSMSTNVKYMSQDSKTVDRLFHMLVKIDEAIKTATNISYDLLNIVNLSFKNADIVGNSNSLEKSSDGINCKFNSACCSNKDIMYCIENCMECAGKREAENHFIKKKSKREHLKHLYMSDITAGNKDSNLQDENTNIILGDRYYYVTLSCFINRNSEEIKSSLIKNFKLLLSPCNLIKAYAYYIKKREDGVIILEALLRQHTPSKCISTSSNCFKNKIRDAEGKSTEQPKTLEILSKYVFRQHQTPKSLIIDKWNYLNSLQTPVGDALENFL